MATSKQERKKRREIRLALYALERKWGVLAELYSLTTVSPDLESGDTGTSYTKYVIPRMVTHLVTIDQKFEYDLSYLAANKNFTYGGIYTPNDRIVVFRNTFNLDEITMEDYIVYSEKYYAMQQIVTLDYGLGWILHLRHTPGKEFYQSHDKMVWSEVSLLQDVGGTL